MNRLFHRFSWVGLVAALLAAPLAAGCGSGEAADSAPGRSRTQVETLVLKRTPFDDVIEITGTIEALDDATLAAQAAGTLTSVDELGTRVSRGETVAQIDPREAQAAVEQAQAQVESAQAQADLANDSYQRQEPLYQDSIISAAEFESVRSQQAQARAALAQARAALSAAEERLAKTRITSPFAGTVEERLLESGEQVSPGNQVVRVISTARVKVSAGVPERYANDIKAGTPVRVNVQSTALEDRMGRITFVGSAVNPQSRTFPIEVETDNADGRLKPAMVAKLYVTREQLDSALVIPRDAVSRDEEGLNAYTVTRQDSFAVAHNREVVLGAASGARAVVRSGLEAGQELVVVGQGSISEGDTVEVARQYESIEESAAASDALGNASGDASGDAAPLPVEEN